MRTDRDRITRTRARTPGVERQWSLARRCAIESKPPDIDLVELWITKPTKDEDKPSDVTSMPGAGLIRTSFREGLV